MKQRFRVGEVAKLFQISPSTLRYYDEIGLLKPKYTDPDSLYRYYTIEQFVVLDTIIFLKKTGFSINDIQQQLEQRTPENTKELLKRKLVEVEDEIEKLKKVSEKIKSKIVTIDEGLSLRANPSLTYRSFPERDITYLYNGKPINLLEMSDTLYLKDLEEAGVGYEGFFTGDFGAIVELDSILTEGPVKYQAAFELHHQHKSALNRTYLEAGIYACYPHLGSYETTTTSYFYLFDCLKHDGYEVTGNPIEIALLDESVIKDETAYVTWIQIPVKEKD